MNRTRFILIGALLAASLLVSCSSGTPPEEKEIIRPVRYAAVQLQKAEKSRTFSGTTKSGVETRLSFRISGVVKRVAVKVGDRIKKGALIASLDNRDAKIKLAEMDAGIVSARVKKQSDASNLKRISELYENNNVSLREYESARSQNAASKADLNARLRQYDLQKSQLSYSSLKSPVDGVVSAVHVENNENVSQGSAVVEISSGDKLEITVGVPEDYIAKIRTGDPVTAAFYILSGQVFTGTVSEISYVGASTSLYPVTVIMDASPPEVRPGMPADVTFFFKNGDSGDKSKLLVPVSAVGEDADGHYVFTIIPLKEEGFATVKRTKVFIGALTGEGFEIESGPSEGQFVVTSGITKITDGLKVRFRK